MYSSAYLSNSLCSSIIVPFILMGGFVPVMVIPHDFRIFFRWVAQSPSRSGPKTSQNPENMWISYKSTGSSIHRHIMTYLPIQHDSFDSQGIHRYPLVHWHLGLALRVDLDIKKHASIENISPSPEVAEAEAPGDAGECCSW